METFVGILPIGVVMNTQLVVEHKETVFLDL